MKEKFKPRKKTIVDPFIQSLLPEDDEAIKRQVGVGSVFALGAALWASTMTFSVIHETLRGDKDAQVTMKIDYEQKKEDKKPPKKEPKEAKAGKSGKMGSPDEPKNTPPRVNNNMSRGVLKMLVSNKASALKASDLMSAKFTVDLNKTLEKVSALSKSGNTSIGAGNRRNAASVGFNPEGTFGNGKEGDGLGELINGLIGGPGKKIGGGKIHSVGVPAQRDIDMGPGGGTRSKQSIMREVKRRMPGLRHAYNKHLTQKPGFSGKVTLRMTISPSGKIIKISKVSSTTGFGKFDQEVLKRVKRWKFEKIRSGNTTVTIPFTFSE